VTDLFEEKDYLTEKKLSEQEVYRGRFLIYNIDKVLLPNGKQAEREVIKHPGAVAVIPVLPDGRIVLVRQYRYAVRALLYELPAGKLDKGEDPSVCAVRELAEETGFTAKKWQKLSSIVTAPGFCDETIHIYLAEDLQPGPQHPDEDEFLECGAFSPGDIKDMVLSGLICDAKTLAGLFLAELLT
jgi:ADP-ribose pyrophosphatase